MHAVTLRHDVGFVPEIMRIEYPAVLRPARASCGRDPVDAIFVEGVELQKTFPEARKIPILT